MQNILIIEDEKVIRSALRQFLEKQKYEVCEAGSIEEAVRFNLRDFSLIISDLKLPGPSGTEVIKLAGDVPVLVMTSYASLRSAVETMKMGAADYIAKPFDYEEILDTIQGIIKDKPTFTSSATIRGMIGACESMKTLFDQIEKVAPTYSNILIEGESGTGKELVAQALHQLSQNANREMVTLNCASVPDASIVPELFGYEKGSIADTEAARVGLIEAANGSTLFLDEIGELPLDVQAQLVSVLEEGHVKRLGSSIKRKVRFRLIASTHKRLKELLMQGRFRKDLYYRLSVITFCLPPLRERKGDLMVLANTFLKHSCKKLSKPELRFSEDCIQLLTNHSWPGNIRELQNTIERSVILSDQGEITPDLLAIELNENKNMLAMSSAPKDLSLENYFLNFVLENQTYMTETQLARQLGISRKSLWEKRQKLKIPREKSRKT